MIKFVKQKFSESYLMQSSTEISNGVQKLKTQRQNKIPSKQISQDIEKTTKQIEQSKKISFFSESKRER